MESRILAILCGIGYFLICWGASWMAGTLFKGQTKPVEVILGGIIWLIKNETDHDEYITAAKYGYIMYLITLLAYCFMALR